MNPTPKSICSFSYITFIYGLYYLCLCCLNPRIPICFFSVNLFLPLPSKFYLFPKVCCILSSLKASIITTHHIQRNIYNNCIWLKKEKKKKTMKAKRQWSDIFKLLSNKKLNQKILYTAKY